MSSEEENAVTFSDLMPSEKSTDLKEGTRIDRYQILGLLGKGGMGAVYKAYDPELDRSIAIKILTVKPQEGETASQPQARLMREAQALAKLSHPNVVFVFDVGTFEEGVYIAMEYVKGKTLREWLKEAAPNQQEILKTLSKAGKGLHAAHTVGIIHRDFKPDNVIIGDRGQVKVLDFGLARSAGSEVPTFSLKEQETPQEPSSGEKLLSTPMTRVGTMVGTTAYMAPEHFQDQELDEKTDQFSFCVTLFEALYGKRPFQGERLDQFEENLTSGWVEVPQEADVPKWIEQIILKGLSVEKEDRYQSIAELLDFLEVDPEIVRVKRRRKHLMSLLLLFLTSIILGLGYYAFFKGSKVCTGADKKVAGIWNEERKAKVKQAFSKTGLSYSKDSFVRVEKRLGDYLSKWTTEYTETCEETRLRDEQPVEIMVLKMGCLDKHLMNAGALTRVFAKADKTVVQKSVQAVSSLSGFSNCNDVEALQSKIPPPKDEQTKKEVSAIREKLSEVEALEKTGKYQEGLALVQKVDQETKEVDYQPIKSEVLYQLGELLYNAGLYNPAETALYEAASTAGKSRNGLLATRAMAVLVWVVGCNQARYKEALSIARDAEIVLDVAGGDDEVRSLLLNNIGVVLRNKGDYEKALEYLKGSLAIRKRLLGKDHPEVAASLNNLGNVFLKQGDTEEALQYYRDVHAILEKALGPGHPSVAYALNNMGEAFSRMSDFNNAFLHLSKALALWKKTLGPDHPIVAWPLNAIGKVSYFEGKYDKALEYQRRALEIREEALGPDHPLVAWPLSDIGEVYVEQGRHHAALEPLKGALKPVREKVCETEPYALGLFSLARALLATGGDRHRIIKLAKEAKGEYTKNPKAFEKENKKVDAWLKKHDGSAEEISTAKR